MEIVDVGRNGQDAIWVTRVRTLPNAGSGFALGRAGCFLWATPLFSRRRGLRYLGDPLFPSYIVLFPSTVASLYCSFYYVQYGRLL
ncbi:uncharacterized protein F4807DRAFT_425215 [Annulohypoxylon truncatum]|uniref:uncharacterized protein n=1 Tax=Annulohypoxylon truncatum TaxID=327061 RepID=UPI0020087EF9|nr:uncharacterized protein F4807DRAFT_425215 [Annulohypoxylon truncatum]KAI1209983.1 hypothetical protein F4807DRAFT_425215 [Annulohypoxylon truncatum]